MKGISSKALFVMLLCSTVVPAFGNFDDGVNFNIKRTYGLKPAPMTSADKKFWQGLEAQAGQYSLPVKATAPVVSKAVVPQIPVQTTPVISQAPIIIADVPTVSNIGSSLSTPTTTPTTTPSPKLQGWGQWFMGLLPQTTAGRLVAATAVVVTGAVGYLFYKKWQKHKKRF